MLAAVGDQIERGGSIHVQAHLARTGAWLPDHPDEVTRALPDVEDLLHERRTASGLLRYPQPAVTLDGGPVDWSVVGSAWAADQPRWSRPPGAG